MRGKDALPHSHQLQVTAKASPEKGVEKAPPLHASTTLPMRRGVPPTRHARTDRQTDGSEVRGQGRADHSEHTGPEDAGDLDAAPSPGRQWW